MSYACIRPLPPFADPGRIRTPSCLTGFCRMPVVMQAHGEASTHEHIEQTLAQSALEKSFSSG